MSRNRIEQGGLTLVELLVSVALLVIAGVALLMALSRTDVHTTYLGELQYAMNQVQAQVERQRVLAYDQLKALALGTGYQVIPLTVGLPAGMPPMTISVRVKPADPTTPADPRWVDVHVSACWTSRGRRIGEDQNCNGLMDAGEDANGNQWLDSPAMASTRIGMIQ